MYMTLIGENRAPESTCKCLKLSRDLHGLGAHTYHEVAVRMFSSLPTGPVAVDAARYHALVSAAIAL